MLVQGLGLQGVLKHEHQDHEKKPDSNPQDWNSKHSSLRLEDQYKQAIARATALEGDLTDSSQREEDLRQQVKSLTEALRVNQRETELLRQRELGASAQALQLESTLAGLNSTCQGWKLRMDELDRSYEEMQALVVDTKHGELAAEAMQASLQAEIASLASQKDAVDLRLVELQSSVSGLTQENRLSKSRATEIVRWGSELESHIETVAVVLNRTEMRNADLQTVVDASRQRELKCESENAALDSQLSLVNATLIELSARNMNIENNIQGLISAGEGKNRALAAAAKRTAWLQEKLTRLSGEMGVAKTILEKYGAAAEVRVEEEKIFAWQAEAQAAAVDAATASINATKNECLGRIAEMQAHVNGSTTLASELDYALRLSIERHANTERRFKETTAKIESNEPFRTRVRELHANHKRQQLAMNARADSVRASLAMLAFTRTELQNHLNTTLTYYTAIGKTSQMYASGLLAAASRAKALEGKLSLLSATLASCDIKLDEFKDDVSRAQQWAAVSAWNQSKVELESRIHELVDAHGAAWLQLGIFVDELGASANRSAWLQDQVVSLSEALSDSTEHAASLQIELGNLHELRAGDCHGHAALTAEHFQPGVAKESRTAQTHYLSHSRAPTWARDGETSVTDSKSNWLKAILNPTKIGTAKFGRVAGNARPAQNLDVSGGTGINADLPGPAVQRFQDTTVSVHEFHLCGYCYYVSFYRAPLSRFL